MGASEWAVLITFGWAAVAALGVSVARIAARADTARERARVRMRGR